MKNLEIHSIDISTSLPLQYADEGIRAGFPSPAQDYMDQAIDLNKELIRHPASTFLGRVVGDSMREERPIFIYSIISFVSFIDVS